MSRFVNLPDERKWRKQRAEKGYSDYDVFEIHTWFLTIMPRMLSELRERHTDVPTLIVGIFKK